ncbi:MAG: hypothetical protein RIT04_194 [Candidatus Parcubacteria bacterium]|jgi:chromosome segregation ATPase
MQNPTELSRATDNLKREWDRETEEFKHEQEAFEKAEKEVVALETEVHDKETVMREKENEMKRLVQDILLKKRNLSEARAKVNRMKPVLENKKMKMNMDRRRIEQDQMMLKAQLDKLNKSGGDHKNSNFSINR